MKHIICLCIAITSFNIYSQTYFDGIYGDVEDNLIVKFARSQSGDHLYGVGFRGTVIKYTPDGSFEYKLVIDTNFYFYDFAETNDNSILVAGMVLVDGLKQGILVKVDETGNPLWTKIFQSGKRQMQQQIVKPVDSVDEFIYSSWYLNSGSDDDIALTKIDGDGNIIWSFRYDYADDQNDGMQADGQGGVIVAGQSYGGEGYGNIMQVDSLGNFVRSKSFSDWPYSFHKVAVASDGNFYLAGDSDHDGYRFPILVKLDSNFDFIWIRELQTGLPFGYPITGGGDVTEDQEGNIYMNSVGYLSGEVEQVVSKFSSSGDLIWNKTTGYSNNTEPFFLRISSYYDGGHEYLNFANARDDEFAQFGLKDVQLFNIGTDGQSCYLEDVIIEIDSTDLTGYDADFERNELDYLFEPLSFIFDTGQWSGVSCDNFEPVHQVGKLEASMIYPNPATNFIYLNINEWENQYIHVAIQNLQGEIVFSQHILAGNNTIALDQLNLSNGVYLVIIKNENLQRSVKLVIEN